MFGPSRGELLLLLHLPLVITLVMAFCMLFSWRTFSGLIAAVVASAVWFGVAISSLGSIVGAFMLMFGAWVTLAIVALSFYLSRLAPHAEDGA